MRSLLYTLVLLAFLACALQGQDVKSQDVYKPFTPQEVNQVVPSAYPADLPEQPLEKPHLKKHHKMPKHSRIDEDELAMTSEDDDYREELTDEEIEERRRQRKRYNKIFKFGMIAGTAVLAVIIFKFCKAKRLRNRNRVMQNMNQQQPYLYNLNSPAIAINPNAYPSQPIQMGRPYPQPQPEQVQHVQQIPVIRGRVHDSCIRQPQVVENPVQAQIRFHQNEILRLRQMKKQEIEIKRRELEMQRVPINTTESFETQHPMNHYRGVPVGQPIYPKDANSSFASEYPEI